jgi:hypothetical protein
MPMNQLELDRHYELAAFLRNRRARVSPEQVGLPGGTRRRTPGLRRPEVAQLAGVSPEFRELWARHDVLNVSEGRKTMHHPLVGELAFDFLWFQ